MCANRDTFILLINVFDILAASLSAVMAAASGVVESIVGYGDAANMSKT